MSQISSFSLERVGSSDAPERRCSPRRSDAGLSHKHLSKRASGCRASSGRGIAFKSRILLVALATLFLVVAPAVASHAGTRRDWRRSEIRRLAHEGQLMEARTESMQLEVRQNGDEPPPEDEEEVAPPSDEEEVPPSDEEEEAPPSEDEETQPSDEEEEPQPEEDVTETTILPPTRPTSTPSSTESSIVIQTDESFGEAILPSPFDTSLGRNFTSQNCPTFFSSFLSNGTFQSCLPFSLLLKNSISFFQASKSLVRITQALDATCNVDFALCKGVMADLAEQISKEENCGVEFREQNPMVRQAYVGLITYEPLYQAGCLRDESGSYCYANAITNASSPSDSYPYYLPLGSGLPGGSRPTCNSCLQQTMGAFSGFAGDESLPLSKTYVDAAKQINLGCGPSYVEENVSVPKNAGGRLTGGLVTGAALFLTFVAALL